MAKTESTAVNELISLVQNKPRQAEPGADLFSAPPARMTTTVPPMRGAGDVVPLPRGRAPQSTSTHQLPPSDLQQQVRMKTASPARGTTIPPLARPSSPPQRPSTPPPIPGARSTSSQPVLRPSTPPPIPGARMTSARPAAADDGLAALDSIEVAPAESTSDIDNALEAMWPEPKATTNSSPTLASPRVTRPSLPPPKPSLPTVPAPRSTVPSMPSLRTMPRATLPPAMTPVAAPFPSTKPVVAEPDANPFAAVPSQYPVIKRTPSVDLTADVVKAENWFDISSKVAKVEETWVGAPLPRPRQRKSASDLARMLVVPAIVAASVGVAIGVYISYRNPKQAPQAAAPAPAPAITMPAPAAAAPEHEVTMPAPAPSPESSNAATASAGGDQPQPPTKAESAATQEAAAAAAAANPDDPAAEPTLTHDAPAAAIAKTETAPVPAVAAPAAAPAPIAAVAKTNATPAPVHEIQTKNGVVKLVDVRIDSKPSGATVTIVDNGKPSFLGTTPLATSLDAGHGYDVIFTLEGRPTQMAHLDPAKASKLEVALGHSHHHATATPATVSAAPAPVAAKVEKIAKVAKVEPKKADTKAAAKKLAEPSFDTAGDAGGEGTLMVSSKPPCEIYVDGKATGLTTPQRSMSLAAGAHKITFVNAAENIKKTVSVKITADQSTKLIQDLMTK